MKNFVGRTAKVMPRLLLLSVALLSFSCGDEDDVIIGYDPDPPSVETRHADLVSSQHAVLNASVNPNGLDTFVWFQWGTDQTFETFAETSSVFVGWGFLSVYVSIGIDGLTPGTAYYFRAVAENDHGTRYGDIESLTTDQ